MMDNHASKIAPLEQLAQAFGRRLEAYRISRQLRQIDLAAKAGIGRATLARLEAGKGGSLDTILRILRALELEPRLLDLIPDATVSPLDEHSRPGRRRKRVRQTQEMPEEPWQWGDEAE